MSYHAILCWCMLRSLVVATLGIWPAGLLATCVQSARSPAGRRLWLFLILTPFFVPELVVGFTYRLPAVATVSGDAVVPEVLYGLLMLIRCVSVGVVVRLIVNPPGAMGPSEYTWRLLRPVPVTFRWFSGWLRLKLLGAWRAPFIAWSLMCLTCFQEFETAALLQIDRYPVSWTVWLFDAQASRQPLSTTLWQLIGPVMMELFFLVPCLLVMIWKRNEVAGATQQLTAFVWPGRVRTAVGVIWILLSVGMFVVGPLVSNRQQLLGGLPVITQQPDFLLQTLRQISVSLAFAASASVVALWTAAWLAECRWRFLAIPCLLPGLCGSLPVALLLLGLFRLPVFRLVYDTWLPMILGQSISILPRAWLAMILLQGRIDDTAIYSAKLLSSSPDIAVRRNSGRLIWRLGTFGWLLGGLLICHWCFWDVTSTSILRPVHVEPIVTRLYNEMHYSRTEAMAVMTTLAVILPLAAGGLVMMIWRAVTILRVLR